MNWDTMMGVGMSMIFFAPLLIALVAFLVVGVLVAFEAVAALATKSSRVELPAAAAGTPGPIVSGLDEAIKGEAAAAASKDSNEERARKA